jgi:CRP/FNR family cyclic AMP-dependent transcriptional regulator
MFELLKTVSFFNKLNDEQLSKIYSLCHKKTYPVGTLLFKEKDQGNVFYILLNGSVKIFTSNAGGEEKILSIFKAGDSFGELSLIDGKPRSASAATLEDSTVYALSSYDFLDLTREHFDIALGIMQELAQRLRDTNQHVHDLTFLDARTRVVKSLILIANKNGHRSGTMIAVKMALNYNELARLAGVPQKVLADVMRDLEEKQLLSFTNEGFAMDLSKLRG